MTGKSNNERARLNSLGLSHKQLNQVLDTFDTGSTASSAVDRKDARWPFRQASISVKIEHPGGSVVEVCMACRNLSRTGAGLLHSSFLHTGTRCVLIMPHPQLGDRPVQGEVVRCQHRGGVLHEIGVRFLTQIDVRGFVRPDPISELFSVERADPALIAGTVLLVEPSVLDTQIIRHFIRDTKVRLRVVESCDEAIDVARAGVDLIISEFRLGEWTGEDLTMRLRGENVATPIILCSADRGGHVLELIDGRRAQAYLSKPLTQEKLTRALAEFLTGNPHAAILSGPAPDVALLKAMKPELDRFATAIELAVRRSKPMDVLSICMQLQSAAPTIGLADISPDLDAVVGQLSESMQLAGLDRELTQIVGRCRAA
ncbi:MAG: response regulator [Phycisphaeraceae bacterium]|nr:MAG: response regulator [Phycisphaeraceae bacterium]